MQAEGPLLLNEAQETLLAPSGVSKQASTVLPWLAATADSFADSTTLDTITCQHHLAALQFIASVA